ncbi:TetR/AcrR family transcriptional regulator [Microbacterium sorbitolivorans]|uniref:TetR/AcrR family transcriptional regulator n=1 Tax=Microbacterium sorbitolivorans TaxID=1867410 RepID=A0A367Y9H7_9MICO|nr:TetR/AcrR family transcriptional regulator [Microbacterium sorbitolivorans]RCK61641.1 TetR/AcrR family transcriptional regulator [Microbacterium sorbitolivorans]
MSESAPNARERRRANAVAEATAFAQARTIEHGLASFTIEDICEAAGFSRRTFFNYFASKEDAVLGILQTRDRDDDIEAAFIASRGDLIDDLVTLSVARWTRQAVPLADAATVGAAIKSEPKILTRMLSHIHDSEQGATALIEQREGYEAGDPRAVTAALIFGTFMRMTFDEGITAGQHASFEDILRARVQLARALFTSTESPS